MLDRKCALVTGATRGIGNAIAVQLARDGYAVAAMGTSEESAVKENLDRIREAGTEFIYIRGSVDSAADRQKAVDTVMKSFGRIDVLVNNAGVAPKVRMDILETTEESFDRVMDINLRGPFFLTQAIARIMVKETKEIEGLRPKIINISSISAYATSVMRGEYCLSKAGISMMTQLFADRLAGHGINVYEIRPGIIATDMTSTVKEKYDRLIAEGLLPIQRWGYPEDIADAVSVLCSDKLKYSTGEVINVDGGFHIRKL